MIDKIGMKTWVNEPTHEHGHTLDNVLSKDECEKLEIQVNSRDRLSDHFPIVIKIKLCKENANKLK